MACAGNLQCDSAVHPGEGEGRRGQARRGENWAGCAEELLTSADRTVRLNAVAAASWNDGTPAPHY